MNATNNNTSNNNWAAEWGSDGGAQAKEFCSKIFFGKVESLLIVQATQKKLRVGEETTGLLTGTSEVS